MRYYVNLKKGSEFKYIVQSKKLVDNDFLEVEPDVFKFYMLKNNIDFSTEEEKIVKLQKTKAEASQLLATEEYVIEIDFKLAMLEIMN